MERTISRISGAEFFVFTFDLSSWRDTTSIAMLSLTMPREIRKRWLFQGKNEREQGLVRKRSLLHRLIESDWNCC